MAVIGLDLGGTKLAGGLFDESGELLDRKIAPLSNRKGPDVGILIAGLLRELLNESSARKHRISGVGVSVPGIAHTDTGRVWAPNIQGWGDYPLREELTRSLASAECRVVVDSDRACSILGEHWKGAARGCSNAIFLAVGTGIGAGILADGRVIRGAQDIAGATGWMSLRQPFREEYVQCGCFEYHASGEGIATVARELLTQRSTYRGILSGRDPDAITARDVFAAFDANDTIAREAIDGAIQSWGSAAANFVSLFNPERIIFGGGIFGPAVRFLEDIRREAAKWAQPISMRTVQFLASELGSDAALYGAAALVQGDTRVASGNK